MERLPPGVPIVTVTPPMRPLRSLPPGLMAGIAAIAVILTTLAVVVPPGFAASFSPMMRDPSGAPIRWNPCEPIHYVINFSNAPRSATSDVKSAVERIEEASGLTFTFDGPTDEVLSSERESYQPDRYGERWAPVLIAWVNDEDNDIGLELPELGLGVPIPVLVGAGRYTYVSGVVAINADFEARPGFASTTDHGSLVLHELGHVVGMGHVSAADEVMYPTADEKSPTDWGPGDRLGLALLGRASGCVEAPELRETQGDWEVDFPEEPEL